MSWSMTRAQRPCSASARGRPPAVSARRSAPRLQQAVQLATGFEGVEFVAAAAVVIVDEDLRHRRAPAAALDHFSAARRLYPPVAIGRASGRERGCQYW